MKDDQYNAADPKQVKKRADKEKDRNEQNAKDLAELLAIPQFRRYIWRHINVTCMCIAKSAFNPNGSFQSKDLGMQSVGAILFAEIEQIDPKLIPQMMLEYLQSQEAQK